MDIWSDAVASQSRNLGGVALVAFGCGLEEITPVVLRNLYTKLLGGYFDAFPRAVSLFIADVGHLIEARNGVSYMRSVFEWLLALLWKGKF
jgi:hypothetical protein